VTCDHCFFDAESVQQANDVTYQMQQRVLLDCLGPVGLPIATHIWRDHMKASSRKRLQLMPPGIPRFGEPMTQDDEWTSTALGEVHADAVCFNETMFEFEHSG